jgi:hypothetical protein
MDGAGAAPIPDATVAIVGNRIVAVGRSMDLSISPEATVIDAKGGTILPGIIDSHVHTTSDPAVRRSILVGGVTSICDLGSVKTAMSQFDQGYIGQEPVARGFRAGPILTAPGGLPDALFSAAITSVLTGLLPSGLIDRARKCGWLAQVGRALDKVTKSATTGRTGLNYEVASPEAARAAVVDLLDHRAGVIKIFMQQKVDEQVYPILSLETVQAIVQAAHTRGVLVRAHVWNIPPMDIALAGGVDVIEHVPKPTISPADIKAIMASSDPLSAARRILAPQMAARDRQLRQMVAQGIVLVPTLERVRWNHHQASTPTPEAEA